METKMQTLMSKGEKTLVFPWRQIKAQLHETQRREGQKYLSPWQTTEIQVQCNDKLHSARSAVSHDCSFILQLSMHEALRVRIAALKHRMRAGTLLGHSWNRWVVCATGKSCSEPRGRGPGPDLSLPWCFAVLMWLVLGEGTGDTTVAPPGLEELLFPSVHPKFSAHIYI